MYDLSLLPNDKNLATLSSLLKESTQRVLEETANWNGRIVLEFSKIQGSIPEWAELHIKLTRQFQSAIQEIQLRQNKIPDSLVKILSQSKEALRDLVPYLDAESYLAATLPEGQFVDNNSCFKLTCETNRNISIMGARYRWYENLGLLMCIYHRTEDIELRKFIGFLAYNYLGKAAPICPSDSMLDRQTINKLYSMFQLSLIEPGIGYNRECSFFDAYFHSGIQEELAENSGHIFFLTDTKEYAELLPLSFFTVESSEIETWSSMIACKLQQHMAENREDYLAKFFNPPLLFDFTTLLEKYIHTSGLSEKNREFDERLKEIKKDLEQAIDHALIEFGENEELRKKLKLQVMMNLTGICRCEVKKVGVLKILPIFSQSDLLKYIGEEREILGEKKNSPESLALALLDLSLSKSKIDTENFLNSTGIRLSSVIGRMRVFEFMTLEEFVQNSTGTQVEYAVQGANILYYKDRFALTSTRLFKRLEALFDPENVEGISLVAQKPYLSILGNSTLKLIRGLLSEISEKKWNKLNHHPSLRPIIQTALFKISLHLADAEMHASTFSKFTESIELIHYEIAALLAIFKPFKKSDFPKIYKTCLRKTIPKNLQSFTKIGLTKSAMNTFAGLSVALREHSAYPMRVFNEGSHFEIVQFVGDGGNFDTVLQNNAIKKVDLYLGGFNHNVRLLSTHNEYRSGEVIKEVEALLQAKSDTHHLTVALDLTIDFIQSPKVKAVLKHFSDDIEAGTLNFVFLRSGQKYELFGMDHFYGSPWFMINNGAKHWKSFNVLTTNEAFQTDPISAQWFCLANKYALRELDDYRKAIFDNAKIILKHVPENLLPGNNEKIKVCRVAKGMEPAFLDIKCFGDQSAGCIHKLERLLYQLFTEKNLKIHSRGGYGYFNPNINLFLEGLERGKGIRYATMRLHPGINHEENELFVKFLQQAEKII